LDLTEFEAKKLDSNDKMIKEYLNKKYDSNSVNHPSHYNIGKIEVIDFIEDQNLGFHLGNTVKYVCRAGKKVDSDELIDLQKAAWYLNRYIAKLANSKKD